MKIYPRLDLDLAAADLRSALAPGPDAAAARRDIAACWPGPRRALAVLSVRTALDLYLQALKLPEGSEVLMSAVTIESMTEIVRRHGLRPVPVDIDLDTLAPPPAAFEAAATPRTRILLLTHLYGALAPLGPTLEFCRRRGIVLVEDCAQAYAGDFYRGHPEADLSMFSFGPIKTQTALGGAVALVQPGPFCRISGCMGQVYSASASAGAVLAPRFSPTNSAGFWRNFWRQVSLQKW